MFVVYVLRSGKGGRLYKGMTNNLKRRIYEHHLGKNKSTKPYRPWDLVFEKEFNSRVEAREYEKWLKTGVGREYLKKVLDL